MHIIIYNGEGGPDSEESNLFRQSATMSDGTMTIRRTMYFESDHSLEDAVSVTALPYFPVKSSAHPLHPQYTFTGNAEISPLSARSKIWRADLEYSAARTGGTDVDGKDITSETPPWKLYPDSVNFTFPEVIVPFKIAYDNRGNLTVPVRNTAGDVLNVQRAINNMQMSFTFATQSWNPNSSLNYANTINSSAVTICGVRFPARSALMLPPEANKITVYEDGSSRIKWRYWSVTVNIIYDASGTLLQRSVANLGDRAFFPTLNLSADPVFVENQQVCNIPAAPTASRICCFRMTQKVTSAGGRIAFQQSGNMVFCGWDQYIAARGAYLGAISSLQRRSSNYADFDLQCEQLQKMPLDANGALLGAAIAGFPNYNPNANYHILYFNQYPAKSWSSLGLPK